MATISIHDVNVSREETVLRAKGISTIEFTSTEVRLDIGFSVRWKGHGVCLMNDSLGIYDEIDIEGGDVEFWETVGRHYLLERFERFASVSDYSVLGGEMSIIDNLHPAGRTSVEVPFELVADLGEWLDCRTMISQCSHNATVLERFDRVLRYYVTANISPDIYGGECTATS